MKTRGAVQLAVVQHRYQRAGFAGECRQRQAIENEAALAGGLLPLSNPTVAANAATQVGHWAANHKAYLSGRLSADGVTSTLTRTGPYGGISLGLLADLGDALENIDRADASSAEHVLRGILGDRMPDLPDVQRTECKCRK